MYTILAVVLLSILSHVQCESRSDTLLFPYILGVVTFVAVILGTLIIQYILQDDTVWVIISGLLGILSSVTLLILLTVYLII